MPSNKILVAPKARKQIKELSKADARRVVRAIEELKADARPKGAEKLSQNPKFWRIRAGDFRIIYAISEKKGENTVAIALVRHRKDAYRDLDKLNPVQVMKTLAPLLASLRDAPGG